MFSRWIVGVVLLFGILLFMLPKTDEQSLAKIGSTSMLACTKDVRNQVASQILKEQAIAVKFENKCPDLIASLEVSEQGDMVITGNRHKLTMRLSPVVEASKVRWSCHGEPSELITKLCQP